MSRIGAEAKPPWSSVPAAVRSRVEEAAGARVKRALRVWGGYAPSPTFRLVLEGGARLVFKGVTAASSGQMQAALASEEQVYRELGSWVRPWAPALHAAFHVADWHVLLLEDLGRPSVPPWTGAAVKHAMRGYAEFHRHSLGQEFPDWLSPTAHHADARRWTELAARAADLDSLAALAGEHGRDASKWLSDALPRMQAAAERLLAVGQPSALLHLDTRSDNLRLQSGGRLRLFDWPYVSVGPAELDLAFFAQSITCEGGPEPDKAIESYAAHMLVRDDVLDASAAAVAGYFAVHAWQPPIPGLPRVRSIQRRQLKASLGWTARRLGLPPPGWLGAVAD